MRNYIFIQIIASIFLIFAILKVIRKYREKNINLKEVLLWLVIWMVVGIVFWLPQATSFLANILGIGRGADLVIYISIIFLFYLLFKIFLILDRQQQEITKIIRHLALNEANKDHQDNKILK